MGLPALSSPTLQPFYEKWKTKESEKYQHLEHSPMPTKQLSQIAHVPHVIVWRAVMFVGFTNSKFFRLLA